MRSSTTSVSISVALLRELGRCGSCGGSGTYKNQGWRPKTYDGPGEIVNEGDTGVFVSEDVPCRKCDGTGLDARVRPYLKEASNG